MEGYIDENRWIDLSKLPRKQHSNKMIINWKNSIGYVIPFQYYQAHGDIHILNYKTKGTYRSTPVLEITIGQYVTTPFEVGIDTLFGCKIKRYVENRIVDFRYDLIEYLDNPEDAYRFAVRSKQKIPMHCPICGFKKRLRIDQLSQCGFSCDVCSDGVSIPNKFMFSILQQLNIPFINEVGKKDGFDWMQSYRYDFYFNLCGENILVEMDGGYHHLEYQQVNDSIKSSLAKENGFKLIRIDCDYKNYNVMQYIQDSIKNSELNCILELQKINWIKCQRYASNSLFFKACDLWEKQGLSIREICEKLKLSNTTIRKYLQRGKEMGICSSYSVKESHTRGYLYMGKRVGLLYNGHIIAAFISVPEAQKYSQHFTGHQYHITSIYNMCENNRSGSNGFDFKYITKEEYEQYKMINDEVVLKKEDDKYDIGSKNRVAKSKFARI